MKKRVDSGPWAVYEMAVKSKEPGKFSTVRVICEQSEWEKLQDVNLNNYVLVRGSIANEVDAERLARETPPFSS